MSLSPPIPGQAAQMREIGQLLLKGDRASAAVMLAVAPQPSAMLIAAADHAMRERRWADAAWYFDQVAPIDPSSQIKRCLCRNLASLNRFRPEIHDRLIALSSSAHCGIGASATGHPTIVVRRSDGQNVALSPGNQPLTGLKIALTQLAPVFQSGHSIALCGIGDGYLFHEIAAKAPALFLGMQQAVFLLEPDPHILLTALMIHDYTGATGPIEQERFYWFLGAAWAEELRELLDRDPALPIPHASLTLSMDWQSIQTKLTALIARGGETLRRQRDQIDAYYNALSMDALRALFGDAPPRRPRVLLLTTRFSTVLQYATFDAASAFQQADWETHVLIEPSPHHRVLNSAIQAALLEFKPDLVFQIDHQRHEHANLFPPNLPFACWIQDHLPCLMNPQAGERVGPTDFVLTDAGSTYVRHYAYPDRQIIPLSKLTTPPDLLPAPHTWATDLAFVSNASGTPKALAEQTLARFPDAAERAIVAKIIAQVIERFAANDPLDTYSDVLQLVRQMLAESGTHPEPDKVHALARAINHPLCDALYRQQALRWVAQAAWDMNLSLSLYGQGWDQNPEFARYGKGPIAAGDAMRAVSRQAAINFQIAPYVCLHQRLLDGVCSGSFFLVREHVSDTAPQEMLELLQAHCDPRATTLDQARTSVASPARDRFERLLKQCRRALCSMGDEDPIEMVRAFAEAKLLGPDGVLPRLAQTTFADARSLRGRIERFVGSPDLREQIMLEQRQSILGRLTYAASLARVTRRIGELLPAESSPTFVGVPISLDLESAA